MQNLKNLITLLESPLVQKEPVIIGMKVEDDSLIKTLYSKIKSNEYQSDEEALKDLYGSEMNKQTYAILKNKLKDRLLNSLFIHQFSSNDKYSKTTIILQLRKLLWLVDILEENNLSDEAYDLVKKAHSLSKDCSDVILQMDCIRKVLSYRDKYSRNEIIKLQLELESLAKSFEILTTLEKIEVSLIKVLATNFGPFTEFQRQIDATLEPLDALLLLYPQSEIKFKAFSLLTKGLKYTANYSKICTYLAEYEDTTKGKKEILTIPPEVFVVWLESLIACKKFEIAENVLRMYQENTDVSFSTWVEIQRMAIVVFLSLQSVRSALNTFYTVRKDPQFNQLSLYQQEEFYICGIWLYFIAVYLHGIEKIEVESLFSKGFSALKFITKPYFQSPKSEDTTVGMSILLLQFFLESFEKEDTDLHKYTKLIEYYLENYFRYDARNKRLLLLLRIVRQFIKSGDDPGEISRSTRYLMLELQQSDTGFFLGPHEFIPFNELWDSVLPRLKSKFAIGARNKRNEE